MEKIIINSGKGQFALTFFCIFMDEILQVPGT